MFAEADIAAKIEFTSYGSKLIHAYHQIMFQFHLNLDADISV